MGEEEGEGNGGEREGGDSRVFLLLLFLDFVKCLGIVAAVLVLELAFALARAPARSAACDSGRRNCACLGLVDCSDSRSRLTVFDRGFSRLSGWRIIPLLRLISAEVARSKFRSCPVVSDRCSCRQKGSTIGPLHLIAVAAVRSFDHHNCLAASAHDSFHRSRSMTALLLHSIAVAVADSDSAPSS